MNTKKKIFIISMPIIMAICSLFLICDYVDAAPRAAVRGTPAAARKSVTVKSTQQNTTETVSEPVVEESEPEEELVIENKSDQFDVTVDSIMESATEDNSFAEMIRKQRAALAASESSSAIKSSMKSGKNTCDGALRTCMMKTCGNDFTKCATDGDTIFGDKLNKCRRDTECSGEEFRLFTAEIKADRDMNVKLSSYNNVINCGNSYNACIINECGTTYTKCLNKSKADAAIQKCNTIAKECTQYDSGLASRVGVITGKLRENAEKDIKKDEEQLYALRDKMKQSCTSMGAMFDERTFDCVYTVNFFAGTNQNTPTASRKRYAGDTFICMQEWFGINATTYKENAYRETRAQTGASSAMLGAGVGTAVGLVTSGAMGRALKTQKAKKELDKAKANEKSADKNNDTTTDDNNNKGDTTKPAPEKDNKGDTTKPAPEKDNKGDTTKPTEEKISNQKDENLELAEAEKDILSQEEIDARAQQGQNKLEAMMKEMDEEQENADNTHKSKSDNNNKNVKSNTVSQSKESVVAGATKPDVYMAPKGLLALTSAYCAKADIVNNDLKNGTADNSKKGCGPLSEGLFALTFKWGTAYGISNCKENESGYICQCAFSQYKMQGKNKLESFRSDGNPPFATDLDRVYSTSTECNRRCADLCAQSVSLQDSLRKEVFLKSIEPVD